MSSTQSRARNESGATQAPLASEHGPAAAVEAGPHQDAPANGGLAAALFACGLACAVFGVLVVVSERFETFADTYLAMSEAVGPLSGKVVVAAAVYGTVWAVLHARLRRRTVDLRTWMNATLILVAVGLIATFPPIFTLGLH